MKQRLILASASPARATTLRNAGFDPHILVSSVDEDAILEHLAQAPSAEKVRALAEAKARDVALAYIDADETTPLPGGHSLIIGCDSMFELDGQVYGKPHTAEVARERLHLMSGRTGTLFTGHHVVLIRHWPADDDADETERLEIVAQASGVSRAAVTMAELTEEEIEAYIASGEPLEVAGSFTIDGRGGPFIESIVGDPHGIVGISLPLVRELCAQVGMPLIRFWA